MMKVNVSRIIEDLEGISYHDWIRIKAGIDRLFELQIVREAGSILYLSGTAEARRLIQSQFECE